MEEVNKKYFHKIKDNIQKEGKAPFPLISSVLNGYQTGKVFLDNSVNTKIVFVLTNFGFSQYFLLKNSEFMDSYIDFLYKSPQIPSFFHLYDADVSLINLLAKYDLVIKLRERKQLRYSIPAKKTLDKIPAGYSMEDCNKIDFIKFKSFNLDLDKRFWSSSSDFYENAYGKCILNSSNDMPVSICYSACIADGIAEIDIATLLDYRGNGFGKMVTEAFINDSISKGLQANWDCFSDNHASLTIATETGFELIKTYSFLSIYNKIKNEKERS